MASSTLRCCHARCDPWCSQNLFPVARTMSATSRVGRFIASSSTGNASRRWDWRPQWFPADWEAVRRTAEVLRKILHRMDVGTNRVLRVVAPLEFIQHQLSEMGHSDLLVTQTLYGQQCWGRPRGSVRRASGLVQTPKMEES